MRIINISKNNINDVIRIAILINVKTVGIHPNAWSLSQYTRCALLG